MTAHLDRSATLHPALLTALRTGLGPGPGPDATPCRIGDDEWSVVELEATSGRIWGLVFDAVARGELALSNEQRERATARFRMALGVCLVLERTAVDVITDLAEVGVECLLLKGADTARRAYRRLEQRCFGDIDLLVRSTDIDAAVERLSALGARRRSPEVRPGWDRRFAKSVTMALPSGLELDLHRTLAPGAFGFRIPEADLWRAPEAIDLLDTRVSVLDRPVAVLHACYHLALGGSARLSSYRDVAQWIDHPAVDATEVHELARRWRGTAVLARALATVAGVVGPVPPEWVIDGDGRRDRRVLGRYRESGPSPLDPVREIPLGQRPAYLTGVFWPSRESAGWRAGSRLQLWRRHLTRQSTRPPG